MIVNFEDISRWIQFTHQLVIFCSKSSISFDFLIPFIHKILYPSMSTHPHCEMRQTLRPSIVECVDLDGSFT